MHHIFHSKFQSGVPTNVCKPLVNVIFLANSHGILEDQSSFIFFFISLSVSPLKFLNRLFKSETFSYWVETPYSLVTRRKRHPNKKKPRMWGTKLTKKGVPNMLPSLVSPRNPLPRQSQDKILDCYLQLPQLSL